MICMQTRDGRAIDLLEPDYSELTIDEIAHALARTARFCGHTRTPGGYSVAQHSVLVAAHTAPEHAFRGLLHDAHEAVIGDIASPVKRAIAALGDGAALEELDRRHMMAVCRRFGIAEAPMPDAVVREDLRALVTERRDLLGGVEAHPWGVDVAPWEVRIVPWTVEESERAFLEAFARIATCAPP